MNPTSKIKIAENSTKNYLKNEYKFIFIVPMVYNKGLLTKAKLFAISL